MAELTPAPYRPWRTRGKLRRAGQIGLTLLLAAVGLVLARQLRLPGGMIIGAMALTAVASLLNAPLAPPPLWLRQAARIVLGLAIGATVTLDTLRTVAGALLPVTFIVLAMALAGLAVARVIHRVTGLPLPTALCGSAPGVLAAMVTLAEDLGGDAPLVASLHLVRLISVMLFVPALARALFPAPVTTVDVAAAAEVTGATLPQLALFLAIGLVVGFLAARLRVPSGDLLATMAVAAVLNAAWLHMAEAPESWRIFAQWIVGAGLGASVTRQTARTFRPFALAGALMTAFFLVMGVVLGWALWRMTSLDPVTCLVASAAGGADQMILLAGELGGNAQLVAAVHVARQIILLVAVPFLVRGAAGHRAPAPSCDA